MLIENLTTEFKREYTDDIKYAVLAFANTDGGKIYIGLQDDGSALGLSDLDGTMLRLTNMLRDVVRPDVMMFVRCDAEQREGKDIIVLTVQRGTARPYYLHGKGIRPEGVYVRQGASSVPASETAILQMIKETSGDQYEEARSLNQQLTFEKAAAYFAAKGVEFNETQRRTLHLIGADGMFTNLGLLLSDQCMHAIKLAVFEGDKKSVFRSRREVSGSLFTQLEEAYAFIDFFNHTRAEFAGLERIDQRDYPPEALREALLNAIVHRDYGISGPILISIFDDRMEFVSIGGLLPGISFADIQLGVSVLRNQYLANIFYRLHLIEAYGTGLLKINECYADHDRKPQISVSDHAFKITLPNLNFRAERSDVSMKKIAEAVQPVDTNTSAVQLNTPVRAVPASVNERREQILKLLTAQHTVTRREVQDVLGISLSTAIVTLKDMVADGLLVKEGSGKMTHYRRK